jgi:hypothetical protein
MPVSSLTYLGTTRSVGVAKVSEVTPVSEDPDTPDLIHQFCPSICPLQMLSTSSDAHLCIPSRVSLRSLSHTTHVRTQKGCPQYRVSMLSNPPRWVDRLTLNHFGSNLPGPFFLFEMHSALGQLVMRIARPVPYLNAGKAWTLRRKHEGTGA